MANRLVLVMMFAAREGLRFSCKQCFAGPVKRVRRKRSAVIEADKCDDMNTKTIRV